MDDKLKFFLEEQGLIEDEFTEDLSIVRKFLEAYHNYMKQRKDASKEIQESMTKSVERTIMSLEADFGE